MLQLKKCKICSSDKLFKIKKYKIDKNLNADWGYVLGDILQKENIIIDLCICKKCGFVFYKDIFEKSEIEKLYQQEKRIEKIKFTEKKSGRKEELKRTFDFFEKYINFSKDMEIIDVGAGDFVILDKLIEKFPEVRFTALDPSYESDAYKDVKVIHDLVEDLLVEKSFDLVLLVHVLEHVSDINIFLNKINQLVNDGGKIYIEVPFQLGPGLLLNRSVNSQHINYFTPKSIENALNLHNFTIKNIEFDRNGYAYNGMPGMIRLLAEKKNKKPIKKGMFDSLFFIFNPFPYIRSKLQ